MKNLFQKVRGKEKDGGKPNSLQLKQNQNDESFSPQSQSQNVQQTPSSYQLRWISSVPLDQVKPLLAQPASKSTEDIRNLIQFPPTSLCPVCCNLDPSKAPSESSNPHGTSWAEVEYKIPHGTPIGKIEVEKSEELLQAAKGGCIYCNVVALALGAIQPGWETGPSFIHIFLATGLPVVVRLQSGATTKVSLGREEALSLGVELSEGQTFNLMFTLQNDPKPPIEVEIYRSVIPEDLLTVGDLALEPLLQNMGFAKEISQHSWDQECFDFIKRHVTNCVKQHKCAKDATLPLLPDRVIWIEANNTSGIRLLEPKNIYAKYIALSYCWGAVSANTYLLKPQNLNAIKVGIELSDLPPLFQDIISIARSIGIEYIWIDRLCIIQGDDSDFRSQAEKMGEIYGNATLTISAASATSENDRILISRDDKWSAANLEMDINGIGNLSVGIRRRSYGLATEVSGGDYGRVSTRAWIWQERLLATRTVFFTPAALKFECRCHSIWEGFGEGYTGNSWSAKLDNMTHLAWLSLVEEYMSRNITRPSDRLPAMNAVMKRIEKSTGWLPFWGLWANALVPSMGWKAKDGAEHGNGKCLKNLDHCAPTWSWASVNAPISYHDARGIKGVENDPIEWDLECQSINGDSGLIRVTGQTVLIYLHVTVERDKQEDNPNERKFTYKYDVRGIANDKGYPITPDVALKPWNGDLEGEDVSTVIRVPYGETPPEESWRSPCACILVGKTKLRSLVLFLGRSLREPGYTWERIGMTDGISPAVFSKARRLTIDMI